VFAGHGNGAGVDDSHTPAVLDHISIDTNSSVGSAFGSNSYRQVSLDSAFSLVITLIGNYVLKYASRFSTISFFKIEKRFTLLVDL